MFTIMEIHTAFVAVHMHAWQKRDPHVSFDFSLLFVHLRTLFERRVVVAVVAAVVVVKPP